MAFQDLGLGHLLCCYARGRSASYESQTPFDAAYFFFMGGRHTHRVCCCFLGKTSCFLLFWLEEDVRLCIMISDECRQTYNQSTRRCVNSAPLTHHLFGSFLFTMLLNAICNFFLARECYVSFKRLNHSCGGGETHCCRRLLRSFMFRNVDMAMQAQTCGSGEVERAGASTSVKSAVANGRR